MIAFVTLFLGLVAGAQVVELAVPADVAAVELRLDGETVATLDGPPWRAEVDLGQQLLPRRLEAVGHAADGDPLGTVEQWINMPASRQTGELLLERDERGRVAAARVLWQSVEYARPGRITVRLDGEELPVVDDRVAIPPHDPGVAHVLSAELEFPDGQTVRDHRLFGGAYGEETQTELTAVALEVGRSRDLRRLRQAEGLLTAGGRPARLAALDRGGFDLMVVAGRSAVRELGRLRHSMALLAIRSWNAPLESASQAPDVHAGMGRGDQLLFVRPIARLVSSGTRPYALFDISQPITSKDGGIPFLLTHRGTFLDLPGEPQRVADAVANAARYAVGTGRARAVLLVLGPDSEDHSHWSPDTVRRYLAAVGVPLRVWYLDTRVDVMSSFERKEAEEEKAAAKRLAAEGTGAEPLTHEQQIARVEASWGGPVVSLATAGEMIDAAERLGRELDAQRVVWIEGSWLPQEVELAPGRRARFPD